MNPPGYEARSISQARCEFGLWLRIHLSEHRRRVKNMPRDLTTLRALAAQYPDSNAALAEIAALRASLTLPKGTVHIVSDVHGEYKKLRHIINNASGRLRPLVEELFADKLSTAEIRDLLAVLYYPRETMEFKAAELNEPRRRKAWVRKTLRRQFAIVKVLARSYRRGHVASLLPDEWEELFAELWNEAGDDRDPSYINIMLDALGQHGRDLPAVRAASHLVRNLSASEIIVAGDLGDRGPRIDKVLDYLMEQPNVAFTWGNHDVAWMGACLGQDALVATVLRLSIRYRRLSQLEEGYGVMCEPLEWLARTVYADDPATHFKAKGTGLREDVMMARMQKAIAIIQFKLEGQLIQRHPEWQMHHRALWQRVNFTDGTIDLEGKVYPLRDTHLPTVDPADPYRLTEAEQLCFERMKRSFVAGQRLWAQMSYVARRGAMWLRRDDALIFHACTPVDDNGEFLALTVDGQPQRGKALMDALENVVRRAFRVGDKATDADKDWFWYLWTGPLAPTFGKDRMATFETYFVADKATHKEKKNAYFPLLHDKAFCEKVLAEFGMPPESFIVNGHVPVKVEQGEQPVKQSGRAITIDGAFSEAYGDRGYTLILAPEAVALAEHHHFASITDAITNGADIVPQVFVVKEHKPPRRIADTEEGTRLRQQITALERLTRAYADGTLSEK